jgi:hypothetical protein
MFAAVYLDAQRSVIAKLVDHKLQTWSGPGCPAHVDVDGQDRECVIQLLGELEDVDEVLVLGPESAALTRLAGKLSADRRHERHVVRSVTEGGRDDEWILRRARQFVLRRGLSGRPLGHRPAMAGADRTPTPGGRTDTAWNAAQRRFAAVGRAKTGRARGRD